MYSTHQLSGRWDEIVAFMIVKEFYEDLILVCL